MLSHTRKKVETFTNHEVRKEVVRINGNAADDRFELEHLFSFLFRLCTGVVPKAFISWN